MNVNHARGQQTIYEKEEKPPECCGKPMKKISREICLQPSHPEHARPMEEDEPCDDFRAE